MDFKDMEVKTMPGTDPGSFYLVVAEGDGYRIGVRPLIMPASYLLFLGARIRVETMAPHTPIISVKDTFKVPLNVKGKHASTVAGVPIKAAPFGSKDCHEVIMEKKLIPLLVDHIIHAITPNKKIKLVVDKATIEDWFQNLVDDKLPTDSICPVEHTVLFNDFSPAIDKVMEAVKKLNSNKQKQ